VQFFGDTVYNVFGIMHACARACSLVSQTAGPIRIKLGTRIHLDPGTVLGKSSSRSECHRREGQRRGKCHRHDNEGTVGSKRDRSGVNAIGIRMEASICGTDLLDGYYG